MILLRLIFAVIWMIFCSAVLYLSGLFRWAGAEPNWVFARLFSWGALPIFGMNIEVEGAENLKKVQPCIYVGNHQSALDVIPFGHIYPTHTVVVGKKEIKWIPFFGLAFWIGGNLFLDRLKKTRAIGQLDQVVDTVKKKKKNIFIFPEGTRNKSLKGLLPFKKGAFHMAVQTGVPIVPVIASSYSNVLQWRKLKLGGGTIRMKILPPIYVDGKSETPMETLMGTVRDVMEKAVAEMAAQGDPPHRPGASPWD